MIAIPPNDYELDLDGDETQESSAPPSNPSQDTDHPASEWPFVYEDAEQWLHGYALPRYLRQHRTGMSTRKCIG